MTDQPAVLTRRRLRTTQIVLAVLALIVLAFAVQRSVNDIPDAVAGVVPDDEYARRYVAHPWLAYLHILPGVVYLLGALLQLSHRFRSRHYSMHRRLGRVLVASGLLSAIFAIIFGAWYAFGGVGEATAAVIFGIWFIACLLLAFRAIRSGDAVRHRRWMIRAFAIGIAVGTIRIWIGLFMATGLFEFDDSFAVAFWLSFLIHAAAAEWWIRTTPHPGD